MKLIINNYLLLHKQSDFTNKLLHYFFQRLQLFLCVNFDSSLYPSVIFTNNKEKINYYYQENIDSIMAFYDEETNTVVFTADRFKKISSEFQYGNIIENIKLDIGEDNYKNYNYIIPLSDLYHELIHSVQYHYTSYEYLDFVEGSDEIFTYLITGQSNILYLKESIALWNLGRKILNLKLNDFYLFIRDSIVNNNFNYEHLLSSRKFINLISSDYKGSIKSFFNNLKNDFGDLSLKDEFFKDLNKLHNLIFYKF